MEDENRSVCNTYISHCMYTAVDVAKPICFTSKVYFCLAKNNARELLLNHVLCTADSRDKFSQEPAMDAEALDTLERIAPATSAIVADNANQDTWPLNARTGKEGSKNQFLSWYLKSSRGVMLQPYFSSHYARSYPSLPLFII